MSVSDPLLKKLKVFIYDLTTDPSPIEDDHKTLQQFCETLECIFRKGLKLNNTIFGVSRRDYWQWVNHVADEKNSSTGGHPFFSMAVYAAKNCHQVMTTQGRGRVFLRAALQKKGVCHTIQQLVHSFKGVEMWYDPDLSILGDEILREILLSLLYQVNEINFQLNIKNCSFLDQTWNMPIYLEHEFVPTKDLGLQIQHCETRVLISGIDKRGVAFDCGKVEVGDVLDTLLGETLRYVQKGRIQSLLRQNKGFPVRVTISKCKQSDRSLYPPIAELLKKAGKEDGSLQGVLDQDERDRRKDSNRQPAHAILPDDDWDELPVHNSEDKAIYDMKYIGKISIGNQGGVNQIEGAIGRLLSELNPDKNPEVMKDVTFELGETDVIVKDPVTKELIYKHSYTEISACGRRIDMINYIAYLAGETTCTLAKDFVAYVFKANNEIEGKTVLCSIAQGFSRTHWFV